MPALRPDATGETVESLLTKLLINQADYIDGGSGTPAYEPVHADTIDYAARVATAGGSVSEATLEALDAFAAEIETASIRDKFYRLNVFCGDDLTTALVPFYNRPSLAGSAVGFAVDQNNGPFIGSDYAENAGLKGNGSSKYLDTGLTDDTIGITGHLGIDRLVTAAAGDNLAGSWIVGQRFGMSAGTGGNVAFVWGGTQSAAVADPGVGFYVGSRTAINARALYHNGSQVVSNTNSQASSNTAQTLVVFARKITAVIDDYSTETLGGYSFGLPMDATQAAAFSTAWATLRTALGR